MVYIGFAGIGKTGDGTHGDRIKTLLGKQDFGGFQYGLLTTQSELFFCRAGFA